MNGSGVSTQVFASYQDSVHGKAVQGGSQSAAVCTDCHGSHQILPANDASVADQQVQRRRDLRKMPWADPAYLSAERPRTGVGSRQSDCLRLARIATAFTPSRRRQNPRSTVSQNRSGATCAGCHQGVRLTQEFGVAGNRVSTYLDSYHGLASKNGSVVVANCASCHGVHNILPSSDPRSTINRANLDATCGQCHKGVTRRFTLGKVHMDPKQPTGMGGIIVRFVTRFYIAMILLVIGGMFLHNAIIWRSKAIARRNAQHRTVERLTRNQRWQHFILMLTFTVLVITGFALKYPDSWFAAVFGMGEKLRGIVHRVAGVALIVLCIYHIIYAACDARWTKVGSPYGAGAERCLRCLWNDAILPGPEQGKAEVRPL